MANPRPPIAPEPTRWTIHGERLVDETRRLRLSIARVELPDGVHFEQYVLRMPKAAMTILLDGAGERVQYQIRPPDVTSYCHCSSVRPNILRLPSCPRSFC
ncbi:MAG: hypothetical protein ACRDTD_16755 [Pseudonocardiaceae bacterium]